MAYRRRRSFRRARPSRGRSRRRATRGLGRMRRIGFRM